MRRSTALTAAAAALLLLAAAYMSIAAYVERSEEVETRRMFGDWMAKFNKTYDSIGEEEHRYAVYKEKFHCKKASGILNVFGDLIKEELNSTYRGGVLSYPVDWSNKGTGGRV